MIAFDTNVLARLYLNDDPDQHLAACTALADAARVSEKVYISLVVLIECVWLLRRTYGWTLDQILTVVDDLMVQDVFHLERADILFGVRNDARLKALGFADLLIEALARDAGCKSILTFDVKASRRSDMFTAVPAADR
ncbi:MAG: PIN domain-containing protein [Pseudomonadota bacterium]